MGDKMSSNEFAEWAQGEIDPNIEKKFLSQSELDQPEENNKTGARQCWYAACNKGHYGVKYTTRAFARRDAEHHQRTTGDGSGVMGPVPC
jgi:hypothetical protein